MLLDLFFLILALLPLVPLSRFRWRNAVERSDLPPWSDASKWMAMMGSAFQKTA